ncbi:glycosyltransferase [Halomonas sp. QX-2]|uniref:Glycosyltransferase n=1 Tax=Vreelandella sedimenti TaxID=2729618 RepID=A0A7Z0NAU0_9GAMM|nr:glycosyltransferase [Halomonas sedimenti]NYT74344.1 glycosyltransferase [Halomonas sedimenti]
MKVKEKYKFGKKGTKEEMIEKYFDAKFYLNHYKDICEKSVSPIQHYLIFGWKEGRNPSRWFSTNAYLEDHADVAEAGINPLLHFVLHGKKEGRAVRSVDDYNEEKRKKEELSKKNSLSDFNEFDVNAVVKENFDESYYLRNYQDIKDGAINPLEHFTIFGYKEGRNPAPWFDTKKYVEKYGYLFEGDVNPFAYYLMVGKKIGHIIYAARDYTSEGLLKLPRNPLSTTISTSGIKPFRVKDLNNASVTYNKKCLDIHWVVPDFNKGGGGHMTIFRFVRWLEIFGHKCTVWIFNPYINDNENEAYEKVVKFFQTVRAEVKFITKNHFPQNGDVLIATSWQTVSIVKEINSFKEKFYFVQDYEPYFYPRGAESILAEETYREGLSCLCASPWLEEKMKVDFGCWAKSFMLAYDKNEYKVFESKSDNKSHKFKIAVYSRVFTARRAVELALSGLELLSEDYDNIEVHLFGGDVPFEEAPFDCIVHGVLNSNELAELYNECDIGVCFSATNYSLVPQEMMACGLPIIELDVESTRAIFPEGTVEFAYPNPEGVKAAVAEMMNSAEKRAAQSEKALTWVKEFSWESSVKTVEKALIEKLSEKWEQKSVNANNAVLVSIVIPTYNGGNLLFDVLDAVKRQRAPWEFEIIVIDSSSNDGTANMLKSYSGIRFYSIDKKDFGHGKTRNYGVELSKGEYVAFLTQDALPADEFWLYNMVALLEHYPNAGGVYGRHQAHDEATYFTQKEIENHFANKLNYPLCMSKNLDLDRYNEDIRWKQAMHYYSDNSSCLRKKVWEKIPYRDVKYGEDQLWAYDITEKGYEKVYSPGSLIKHSHDYLPEESYERSKIDGDYFSYFWNYNVVPDDPEELDKLIKEIRRKIASQGAKLGLKHEEWENWQEVMEKRLQGLYEGQKRSDSIFAPESKEASKY